MWSERFNLGRVLSLTERSLQSEEQSEKSLPNLGTAPVNPTEPVSFARTLAACVAALVMPGLGHLVLGRWARGWVIGLGIAAMFGCG